MEHINHLQFDLQFDRERLKADLAKVLAHNWTAHYNSAAYSGSWTSIALLSAGGKSGNINALPNEQEPVTETEVMEGCAYFREVLNSFECTKTTARLLRLDAGAVINPHRDYCLGYEDGVFRIHIPIITNPEVEFILAGERIVMEEGSCWYIDANEEHSVANKGSADRIHLVIDGNRNDWTDSLFFSMAAEEQFRSSEKETSGLVQQQIIDELERMGTPAAKELLKQMKR